MAREIKFRAWVKEDNKWFTGWGPVCHEKLTLDGKPFMELDSASKKTRS